MSGDGPGTPEARRHDPAEVIEVASEVGPDAGAHLVTGQELREIAAEVGITPEAVERAVAEIDRRKELRRTRVRALALLLGVGLFSGLVLILMRSTGDSSSAARAAGVNGVAATETATPTPTIAAPPPAAVMAPVPAAHVAIDQATSPLATPFTDPPAGAQELAPLRVGLDIHRGKPTGARAIIEARGATALDLAGAVTPAMLRGLDVLLLIGSSASAFTSDELDAVERFVRDGGGIVAADLGWWWTTYPKRPIAELPLNVLGERLGFTLTEVVADAPVAVDGRLLPGVTGIHREGWVPCEVRTRGESGRVLLRDGQRRAIAASVDVGRGRAVVFGHTGMPEQNPTLVARAVALAARRPPRRQ